MYQNSLGSGEDNAGDVTGGERPTFLSTYCVLDIVENTESKNMSPLSSRTRLDISLYLKR